jgi:4-hydroxybenzoate polyprenyltransferase
VIVRWGRYLGVMYRPSIQLPYSVSWALGLTALFACVTGAVASWRPDAELIVTVLTLVITMLLIRAMDDIRDLEYDRRANPGRPLPSGLVRERDLVTMVAMGSALLLLINASRGAALAMLVVQMVYTFAVVAIERMRGWPHRDRLGLQLAINLPILIMLSLYVYLGFLRSVQVRPNAAGFAVVAGATTAALCMELGRKVTRKPPEGEKTYVTVLGASGTSLAALGSAVAATLIVLVALGPWHPGNAWGWLVLVPLLLPGLAVVRFAAGAARWPLLPTVGFIPAMYTSFLVVGLLTKGALA